MENDDERLRAAIQRFLAEEKKYDSRFPYNDDAVTRDFLEHLRNRPEEQSAPLRELVGEAKTEIHLFLGVRSNFMALLANLKTCWVQIAQTAEIRVFKEALKVGRPAPPGLTALEALNFYLSDFKATHSNLQRTGADVIARLHAAVEELISALDGATGIIAMRLATLETFRRAHLLSSWDQLRERLDKTVEDEIRDAFTEETVKHVAEILLKHGLDAGEVFVPGVKLIAKLVMVYYKFTKPPEKYKNVGGADILLSLVGTLRKEKAVFEQFEKQLSTTFDKFMAIHEEILNGPLPGSLDVEAPA
jgi:hypothetical protein